MSTNGQDVAAEAAAKKAPKVRDVEVVAMTDGRKVEFAGPRRRMLKEVVLNEDGSFKEVRFDFRNGEVRHFLGNEVLSPQALGHGWSQKIGDETAGEDDVEDMILLVDGICERLAAAVSPDDWSAAREAGGMSGTSVLLKALVEFSGKSVDDIKAYLKNKTQQDKMAMRAENSRKNGAGLTVKAIVDRLESEKVSKAAKVDVASLFEGLGAV